MYSLLIVTVRFPLFTWNIFSRFYCLVRMKKYEIIEIFQEKTFFVRHNITINQTVHFVNSHLIQIRNNRLRRCDAF